MVHYHLSYVDKDSSGKWDKMTGKSRFSCQVLCPRFLNEALLLPHRITEKGNVGGVVDSEGHFVIGSGWKENDEGVYDYDEANVVMDDAVAIYIGLFNPTWGHVITDGLKKLWYLHTDECKKLIANGAKVLYSTVFGEPFPEYERRIFELAVGKDVEDFVLVTEPTRFRTLVVPDNSIYLANGNLYFTKEYVQMIHLIQSRTKQPVENLPKKIYFTRCGLVKYEQEMGELSIMRLFHRLGYAIYAPERLSVDEQIALLKNCEEFVATEGSISHSSIFCKPNTKIVLLRKFDYFNKYSFLINEAAQLDVTYIDVHKTSARVKSDHWGPYYLYIGWNLVRWTKKCLFFLPYWLRPSYFWYCHRYDPFIVEKIRNRKFYHRLEDYTKKRQLRMVNRVLSKASDDQRDFYFDKYGILRS